LLTLRKIGFFFGLTHEFMFLTNKCLLQILTFQEKVQAMKKEDFNFQPMVFTSRISLFHILIVEKILPNVTSKMVTVVEFHSVSDLLMQSQHD